MLTGAVAWTQDPVKLAPYYPTPNSIVMKMLELGALKPGEKMFDLGSGDGRIVIAAAQKFHADAIGVELDKDLCKQSQERIRKLGLEKTAQIVNGDILKQDYASADLITVYLLPNSNDKVQPLLERQLKKGARVVAHDFEFRGWTPVKVEDIEDDGEGRSHTLFLYLR
jgi:protein-L-isoaspartate O-methyltransferase